jgi:hexosaminidase
VTGPERPGLERRAYMLDVSRDRVPTGETLDWLIGILAAAGFNELQLYVEHTFTYRGHETVWEHASPLTHADMARLDDRCASAGLDLVANMNGFGHMARWLEHDRYRGMAECPDGFTSPFDGAPSPPGCLAPTVANAQFAVELARDMASAVRHRRLHIGADEPFELGDCVSAAEVAARGRDHVYLDHLKRIIEPLVADGHEVMFWADLFRRDASLIDQIPSGAVAVAWNYEAPSAQSWMDFLGPEQMERLGLPADANRGFVAHARLFIESATPFWVAPGTSTWNTIIGRNINAAANIADAVSVGRANSSPGVLLTDWGDNGHWQPLAVSLPSIMRAGVASRTGELPTDPEVATMIDEFAGFDPGTGRLIDELGRIGESLGVTSPNGSPLCAAMTTGGLPSFGTPDDGAVRDADLRLAAAVDVFASGSVGGPRGAIVATEMAAACRLARLGLHRLAAEHRIDLDGRVAAAPDGAEVESVIADMRAAWLSSSRAGGLDDSIAKVRR